MLNIKIGDEYIKNVTSFEMTRTHGLSRIENNGDVTIFEGFYNGNYFKLEEIKEYGFIDYDLLVYKENYKDVEIGEELENLIDFVANNEVIKALKEKNIICNYGRIN